jgi:predicted RNA-binding Zn-ribbon protein involved in translation (DUF1610 family)
MKIAKLIKIIPFVRALYWSCPSCGQEDNMGDTCISCGYIVTPEQQEMIIYREEENDGS